MRRFLSRQKNELVMKISLFLDKYNAQLYGGCKTYLVRMHPSLNAMDFFRNFEKNFSFSNIFQYVRFFTCSTLLIESFNCREELTMTLEPAEI